MLDKLSWSSSANPPPIPRWGLEPYEHEPAHGFFLRLAAFNGQQSIPSYAMSLGLNGNNIDPQQMLRFCEQLPIAGIERLHSATPRIVRQSVYLRGEHLRLGRDWSIRRRRYCPECVREESYHRFWFDVAVVRVCPAHGLALVSRQGGMKLAWEDSSPLTPLERVEENSPDQNRIGAKWSEYAMGRLGAWPVSSQPLLDMMPLLDVVYLCNAIGAMSKYGWKHRPGHGRSSSTSATAEGFHYIANGGSLETLCDDYLRKAPSYEKGEFSCKDTQLNLGWLYSAINSKQYRSATTRLRQAMDESLIRNRACRPLKNKMVDTDAPGQLYGLSTQLGLYPSEIRQLARWLSINTNTRGQFCAEVDIPRICLLARNLVPSEAAAQALGVPLDRFPGLQIGLGIKPALKAQAGRPARYDIRQIERLVDDLRSSVAETDGDVTLGNLEQYRIKARCSFATAASGAVGGALPVQGWRNSEAGIMGALVPMPAPTSRPYQTRRRTDAESVITSGRAASQLNVGSGIISKLIRARVLTTVPGKRDETSLDREGFERFRSEFAPAHMFASLLGGSRSWAGFRLQQLGLELAYSSKEVGADFVRRRDAERALNLQRGEFPSLCGEATFWKALEEHLQKSRCSYLLYWRPDSTTATVRDGTGRARVLISLSVAEGSIALGFPINGRRQEKLFQSRLPAIRAAWPNAAKNLFVAGAYYGETIRYNFHADPLSAFLWVEECLQKVRAIFVPS